MTMARVFALLVPYLAFVQTASADFSFLLIGDWGNDNKGQYADAKGMETIAEIIRPEFVVMAGDNFYSAGIDGSDKSPRFQTTFEDVYNGTYLETIDFYVIAGNHDHGGNVSAQIAYTQDSARWKYPDWWYSEKFDGGDFTMELLMFDTVIASGSTDDNENRFDAPPGPRDPSMAEAQWTWISEKLNASTADYLMVAGHYPVWSPCSHGPTAILLDRLKPQLEAVGAHYLAGHDHCEGHVDEGKGPHYIVAGAGMECCYDITHVDDCPEGSIKFWVGGAGGDAYQPLPFKLLSGFASIKLSAERMAATFHAHNGTELYTTPDIPPRTPAQKAGMRGIPGISFQAQQ